MSAFEPEVEQLKESVRTPGMDADAHRRPERAKTPPRKTAMSVYPGRLGVQ